jgi:hypothetical protein
VPNDGLWVKFKQATTKQWWTLHQPHIYEFKSWIMINIDQQHHSKKVGTHTCASSVTLTPLITSGKGWPLGQIGRSKSKTVVGIATTTYL